MSNTGSIQFRTRDYIKITIFALALTALWQSMHSIILPIRLLDFVEESQKNTYLGLLTLSGSFLAMVFQPLAGAVSDRSGSGWGRRRPYILIGGLVTVLFIPGVGVVGSYAAIFIIYCLMQVATNTAQGPFQAFIPDLVPENKRGLASGVKALFEIVGGVALVYISSIFMDRYFAGEGSQWLWFVLIILAIFLLGAVLATVFLVRESPIKTGTQSPSLLSALYQTAREVMANPDMKWFLVSRLLIFMAFTTIQQFALYYLSDVVGVTNPAEATAQFIVYAVIGMLLVVWPAGYLCDKIGRKSITLISGLLGALGIGIIALTNEYNTILWAAAIIGVAMGAFNSTNWALATDLVVKGEEARYLGIANMATAGGAALARAIGPVIDFFNNRSSGIGYQLMLYACIAYFVIGGVFVLKIRRRS